MAQVSPITSTESNSGRLANGGVHYKRGGGDNSTDTGGREKASRRDMPSAFGLVESEVRACVCVCVCPCVCVSRWSLLITASYTCLSCGRRQWGCCPCARSSPAGSTQGSGTTPGAVLEWQARRGTAEAADASGRRRQYRPLHRGGRVAALGTVLLSVGSATEIDVSGGSCLSDVSVRLFLTLNACVSVYARFVVRVGSLVDVCRPYCYIHDNNNHSYVCVQYIKYSYPRKHYIQLLFSASVSLLCG